eukprot:Rmarinus@m.6965
MMTTDKVVAEALSVPKLASLGRAEVRRFLEEYRAYKRALSCRDASAKPVSILAGVDPYLLRRVAEWNLKKGVDSVGDDEFLKFLQGLLGVPTSRAVDLRGLLTEKVVFDLSVEDPRERISLLFGTLDRVLEEDAGGMELPDEQKCRFILLGLRPLAVQKLAINLVSFEEPSARKDPRELFDLLWKHVPEWERCLKIAELFDVAVAVTADSPVLKGK